MQRRYRDMEHRLLSRSVACPSTGCWIWLGAVNQYGYGRINYREEGRHKGALAHRIAYATFTGETVKKGYDVHHQEGCDRRCINPGHLELMYYKAHRAMHGFPTAKAPQEIKAEPPEPSGRAQGDSDRR